AMSALGGVRGAASPSTVPMVSTSLVLARPGRPTSSAWPPESTVINACSTTRSCPKITLPIAALAAATCAPVASTWRTIMSSSFSSPSVATAMTSAPCYLTVVRACYGPDRQLSPLDLTKKRATFGPLSHAAVDTGRFAPPNPSQLLEITLFFTGCDPASAQVCHDRPRTRPGRKGRKRLGFSGPTQRPGRRRKRPLAIATGRETALSRTSSRQTMADQGSGGHSTHREAQTISAPGDDAIASLMRPDC